MASQTAGLSDNLHDLLTEIRACTVCSRHLSHGPRPIVQAAAGARILIIGQAPGTKVHTSGIPWDDASGNRLRTWMDIDRTTFYDAAQVAVVPMGFCFPGKGVNGDLPPRPECAPLWHKRLLTFLSDIKITLLIGRFAQAYYLSESHTTLTENVRDWRTYAPRHIPLPHPSPRNRAWFAKNKWFDADLVPYLQRAIAQAL